MRAIVEPFLADPPRAACRDRAQHRRRAQLDQRDSRPAARPTSRSCTTTIAGRRGSSSAGHVPRGAPLLRPRLLDCDFIDGDGRCSTASPPSSAGLQPRTAFFRSLYRRTSSASRPCSRRRSAYDRSERPTTTRCALRLRHVAAIAASYDVGFLDGCDAGYRVHASQTTNRDACAWASTACSCSRPSSLPPAGFASGAAPCTLGRVPAVDARRVQSGERLAAVAQFGRALLEYPAAPIDPRIAALVIGSRRRGASTPGLGG